MKSSFAKTTRGTNKAYNNTTTHNNHNNNYELHLAQRHMLTVCVAHCTFLYSLCVSPRDYRLDTRNSQFSKYTESVEFVFYYVL